LRRVCSDADERLMAHRCHDHPELERSRRR
jgi:hypothetical protein